MTTATRFNSSLIWGIFIFVGLVLLALGTWQSLVDWRFAHEARAVKGTVLSKTTRTSTAGRTGSRSRTQHYEAIYRFAVQGEMREGRDELTQDDWERLKQGGQVDVLYLPDNPSSNRLAGPSRWFTNALFVLIGLVLTATGAVAGVRVARRARLEARLQQQGVSTKGTIIELAAGTLKLNNVKQWRLRYEYEDAQGHRHVQTFRSPRGGGASVERGRCRSRALRFSYADRGCVAGQVVTPIAIFGSARPTPSPSIRRSHSAICYLLCWTG